MERQKFEESWKEAFDQAEISPSENVWTNIELDLEKEKASKLKRRLVFYQLLAAASVIFTMGIGVGVYVNNGYRTDETLAARQTTPASTPGQAAPENTIAASGNPSAEKQDNTEAQKQEAGLIAGATSQNKAREGQEKDQPGEGSLPVAGKAGQSSNQELTVQSKKQHDNPERAAENAVTQTAGQNKKQELLADNTTRHNQGNNTATTSEATTVSAGNNDKTALSRSEGMLAATAEEEKAGAGKEDANAVFTPSFERKLPALVVQRKIELVLPQEEKADPVALMLARLERREQEVRQQEEEKDKEKEKDNKDEKLWTSVGFAAGSFNPVVSKTSTLPQASYAAGSFASNASKEVEAKGATYSVGVNMGTRLSERWVLQGGVNYLTQASDYTQNGLIPGGLDNNTLMLPSNLKSESKYAEGDEIRQTAVDTPPYNVNNSVRYLSVPMQAGYMIINKGFGLQLNAGVSTDLLLQNTITATVDGEAVVSDFEGSDYRQVNLSGLMGSELSYRFGRRYRVALNPGLRYPFSNIYKSDYFKATRLSFDVGLRFRYIFN